ncbi:hypothetical protein ACIA5G_51535 [Amycolatopsis sp. NPDC051758]|uniref:hypothetical protein n=1 Tax=Amycolatopsis sp. NPDC051758 TaxID=3363935 RepID=UPI003787E452
MTSSHHDDPSDCSSDEHGVFDPPTIPIPHPRRQRTRHRVNLRNPRPARPSTVWPCAQDDVLAGTGLLAGWLLTAIIKIVTTYTRPGQRVLLVEPAPYLSPSASRPVRGPRGRSLPGPYAGLHEAGWTVVRLGRGVRTQTAVAVPGPVGEQHGAAPDESESGPGPLARGPVPDEFAGHGRGRDPVTSTSGPDRYDLVIIATEPRALDWFRPADWADLLTSIGTLAVITHGHREPGRVMDPAGPLVRAAHHVGVRYLDRVALLRVPVRDGALAAAAPAAQIFAAPIRHLPVHDDLLVFTRQPTSMSGTDGGGDLR